MNIREIRREIGLSQVEFARLLNVHQTAVSQWETGRTFPEAEMLIRISRITGRSVSEILNDETTAFQEKEKTVICRDEGMLAARIAKGDEVYYRECDLPEPGSIVAVKTPEGVLIRYYYEYNGQALLVGAAGYAAPRLLSQDDRILGQVYAFRSVIREGE